MSTVGHSKITIRQPKPLKAKIAKAAALRGMTVTSFINGMLEIAAERTLLAWLRTGITVIGLGFMVAKFGLFLSYIAPQMHADPRRTQLAMVVGVLMVLLGAVCSLGAAIQFRRFIATLSQPEVPPRWSTSFVSWIAFAVSAVGLLLAVYLLV